jgi:hypothetical protein
MPYPTIKIFEAIFSLLEFENAGGAAAYYVLLINEEYPCPFENIKNKVKDLPDDITVAKVKHGRQELLDKGITAKVISKELVPDDFRERFVFRWSEVPGNDETLLRKYLEEKFNINWINATKIEKNDIDNTVRLSTGKNFLTLRLDNKTQELLLKTNDGRTRKFIAKKENDELNIYQKSVIDDEDSDESSDHCSLDYGFIRREEYLPTCPLTIWTENKNKLKRELKYKDEEIRIMEERIQDLKITFVKNFKKFGVGIDFGSINLIYTKEWILNTIIHNMRENMKKSDNSNDTSFEDRELLMMLSGLRTFEKPFISFYEKMLNQGLTIRALFDRRDQKYEARIKIIEDLKKRFPKKFQIRFSPIKYATSRRIVMKNIAIDARRLIFIDNMNKKDSKNYTSYYIGTVYIHKKIIHSMKELFNGAWERGLFEEDIRIYDDKIIQNKIINMWNNGERDRAKIASEVGYTSRAIRTWIGEEIDREHLVEG